MDPRFVMPGVSLTRPSRSWPGCAACRCRGRVEAPRDTRATGAAPPPGAAGRSPDASGIGRKRSDSDASDWSPSVPTAMIRPFRALTSSTLLSVFECSEPLGATKTQGVACVDQRDRAVLHLGGRIALGVDVADLLELERPFERDRVVQISSEVEHASRRRDQPRRLFDQRLGLQDLAEQRGNRFDRLDDRQSVRERQVPEPREMKRQQEQHGHLRRETPWCWRPRLPARREDRCRLRPRGRSCCRRC